MRVDEQSLELNVERKEQKDTKDKNNTRREQTHTVFHQTLYILQPGDIGSAEA